jgi:hypothetical protein
MVVVAVAVCEKLLGPVMVSAALTPAGRPDTVTASEPLAGVGGVVGPSSPPHAARANVANDASANARTRANFVIGSLKSEGRRHCVVQRLF